MGITLEQAKRRILNKWNWDDPDTSFPVILWGPPGMGKTDLVISLVCERMIHDKKKKFKQETEGMDPSSSEFLAKKKALDEDLEVLDFENVTHDLLKMIEPHCLVIRLAERPIEQLQGVVVPSMADDANFVRFLPPENLAKIAESDWGIVFLDELDKASDAKFGAATHILENKVVGDFQLGKGWYILAAANREEDSHLSNAVPPELLNRCANIEVEPNLDVWIKWASTHNVRKDFISFHKFSHGKYISQVYNDSGNYSYGTARSWTHASRVIDNIQARENFDMTNEKHKQKFREIVKEELKDFVGTQAAIEFDTYVDLYMKFNVHDVLSGKYEVPQVDHNSMHDTSAISDQCIAAFAIADQLKPEHIQNSPAKMKNLVNFISSLEPEIRTLYLQLIHKSSVLNVIIESNIADDLMEEIITYIAS